MINHNSNTESVSKYTQNLQREYYASKGVIPTNTIFDVMFRPPASERRSSYSAQRNLTDRLLKHKENVNIQIKEKQYQKSLQNAIEKKNQSKIDPDYRMYDYQIMKEMQK